MGTMDTMDINSQGSNNIKLIILSVLIVGTVLALGAKTSDVKTVRFLCDNGTYIMATFNLVVDESVNLALSDGRTMTVPRALSASGARYANADESFVFWNKGDTAFITEGAGETYSNCVVDNSN